MKKIIIFSAVIFGFVLLSSCKDHSDANFSLTSDTSHTTIVSHSNETSVNSMGSVTVESKNNHSSGNNTKQSVNSGKNSSFTGKTSLKTDKGTSQSSSSHTINSESSGKSSEVSNNRDQTYTVTFTVNGAVVLSDKLYAGDPIVLPQAPADRVYTWDREVPASMPAQNLSITAASIGGNAGYGLTWAYNFNGKITISGQGGMPDYSMNSQPWIEYRDEITEAAITSSVTTIGDYAFFRCPHIGSVVIPDSVQSIGNSAFLGCDNLQNVVIGKNVSRIGTNAFTTSFLASITFVEPRKWYATIKLSANTSQTAPVIFTTDPYANARLMIPYNNRSWSTNYY